MTNISERLEKILEEVTALMDCTPIEAIAVTTVSKSKEPNKKKKEAKEDGNTRENK